MFPSSEKVVCVVEDTKWVPLTEHSQMTKDYKTHEKKARKMVLLVAFNVDGLCELICDIYGCVSSQLHWIFFGGNGRINLLLLFQQLYKTSGCDDAQKCSWYLSNWWQQSNRAQTFSQNRWFIVYLRVLLLLCLWNKLNFKNIIMYIHNKFQGCRTKKT